MTLLSRSYEDGCEGLAVGAVRDEELDKHVVVAQNVVKVVGVQRDHLVIPVDPNELVSDVASRHQLRVLLSFLLDLLHLLLDLTRTNYNLTTNGIFRFYQLDLTASAKETHLDSPRKE